MSSEQLVHLFTQALEKKNIVLSERQLIQFQTYYDTLVSWNEQMNLTRVTNRNEVYWKHFYDSLTPAFFVNFNGVNALMDVGSGAGFPAIPLKIVYPHLQVTVVDALNKRLIFLNVLLQKLQLRGVDVVHGRAETMGQAFEYREQYDVVTARAVARLNVLCEYCLPFVRVGGLFIAMKGDQFASEINEAMRAVRLLGSAVDTVHQLTLPEALGNRALICIRKERRTPKKFPRRPGIPKKEPL